MRRCLDKTEAIKTALRYLSYKDRTTQEVVKKLQDKGFGDGIIEEAVSYLTNLNYLNDTRFAFHWADSMDRNKNWGKKKILKRLAEKGLSISIINKVEEAFDESRELFSAKRLLRKWIKKNGGVTKDLKKVKASAYRHMITRGFTPRVALETLKDIHAERDTDR